MTIHPFSSKFFMRLSGTALAVTLSCASAAAEQVTLRVHHFLPATSSAHIRMIQPWCEKVAKESNDQLKCQIYPAMQLGGTPAQLFDQAKDGVADLVWTVPTYAAGRFSKAEVFELPWMAASSKSGSQALWSFVEKFAQDEFQGVRPIFMHVHDGALFHFTSKQPKTLEDMKGLKIRAATRANSRMIAALGAAPVQMPLPQVPESLAKGVLDGAAVPWEGAPAIKLNEITKYHLDVPPESPRIANTIFIFGMNKAKYDGISPALKQVIDANSGLGVSAWAGEMGFDRVAEIYRTEATKVGGVVNNLSEAEYRRWVDATKSVEEEWIREVGAKGIDGHMLLVEARRLVERFSR